MTKPDDIPQDVWDVAASAYFAAWNVHDEMFNPLSNSISVGLTLRFLEASARAIMAEREACAIAACPPNKVFGHSGGIEALGGYISGRSEAAAAIRNRGAVN